MAYWGACDDQQGCPLDHGHERDPDGVLRHQLPPEHFANQIADRQASNIRVADDPVHCRCPRRIDGGPPALHKCTVCGFESGVEVHTSCAGCACLASRNAGGEVRP